MTTDQRAEWDYRYTERLAIMCEDRPSNSAQEAIAKREADLIVFPEMLVQTDLLAA